MTASEPIPHYRTRCEWKYSRTTRDFDIGPKVDGFIDVKSLLTIVSCEGP